MLRLQSPLPERYTSAAPEELSARISAARAALGERVFILGHHYQRDEVMRWADARGDSYRLPVLAQTRPEEDSSGCCGVHLIDGSDDFVTALREIVMPRERNGGSAMGAT